MNRLFIRHYRIDIQRCQVYTGEDTLTLEPKVMQVLVHLARHQGEVVSHQALLDEIWGKSIVDPSSLQRCIGQLRKAFGDNAKQQHTIATYPKNGYSLLPEVQWEEQGKVQGKVQGAKPEQGPRQWSRIAAVAAGLAIIALLSLPVISYLDDSSRVTAEDVNGNVSALLRDTSDFYAAYSPDGRYVVYPRFVEGRLRNLWVQDLANGREQQLTPTPGYYEDAAWSPDSLQVAFVESVCSDARCRELECSALKSAAIAGTSSEPTTGITLVNCQHALLQSPQWLDESTVAFIENAIDETAVIRFDIHDGSRTVLFRESGVSPQHLAFSRIAGRLAVSVRKGTEQALVLLDISTGEVVTLRPKLPEEASLDPWQPMWNPQANGLLVSGPSGVYSISLDGRVSRQHSPFLPEMSYPSYH